MAVIEVDNLVKTYDKKIKAVDSFSFNVEKGELIALVGPDGAGKTSLFRSICNLINFDSGTVKIAGYDLHHNFEKIKPRLGYMPQTFSLYPDLTVEENLDFYSGLFALSRKEADQKKEALYTFSGLGPFSDRRAAALSGGMKQKLALSCNLIHDPEILILDEPTTGVDPLSRRQFWDILKQLKSDGSTIVVSTPYMDEVALADYSIFIYQGAKLAEGSPKQLIEHFQGQVYKAAVHPTTQVMNALQLIKGLTARRFGSSVHIYLTSGADINDFREELEKAGINEGLLEHVEPDLEDTFIQLMGT